MLGLPRAQAALGVAADSHPTIHASHSFHGADTVDVGTQQGKKEKKPTKNPNQNNVGVWLGQRGNSLLAKIYQVGKNAK